ncbi:hypothetical protein BD311DRAFT_749243 [Dichomitus squalens]|uniref:Uncharacterized protein n=1 Tax=Dichomitus squalens TaxID=114155 RepID=A0A4Q9MYB8_9APHY|nr:hypothetical protein BD311DRAFT_749243 [Dichomitus squalens]
MCYAYVPVALTSIALGCLALGLRIYAVDRLVSCYLSMNHDVVLLSDVLDESRGPFGEFGLRGRTVRGRVNTG